MIKKLSQLREAYEIEDVHKNFKKVIDYVNTNSLQELVLESESFYLSNKEENYNLYKRARLDELINNRGYMDIIFHLVVRRIKPISSKILATKGRIMPPEYFNGKPFFYQFEMFSRNNSLDMEKGRNSNLAITDLKENLLKYEILFEKLGDIKSRNVLTSILMARLSKDPMYYFDINDSSNEKAYFDMDLIQCSKEEVFVDCGGYIGDTVKEYLSVYGHMYKKIYVYEPSSRNYETAKINLKDLKNVTIRKLGVSDKPGLATFSDIGNEAAAISDKGNIEIELTTLDRDILEPITLIKVDVEGYELQALKGAENHIIRDKPKISVCLYHRVNDLWRIPEYLSGVNEDYKFYLRHYQNCYTETILYAI